MTNYIYALVDPRNQAIRYVGKTRNLYPRWQEHVANGRDTRITTASAVWVRGLLADGVSPEMVILECTGDAWHEAEERWIDDLRALGHDLLNVRKGGYNSGSPAAPARPPLRWYSPERGFYTPDPVAS